MPENARKRVVVLRGHQANPWELRPWELVDERYEVSYLRGQRGWFDTSTLDLDATPIRTLRDVLPPGKVGDLAVRLPGDRYLGLADKLRGADIVHAQELSYWYAMQGARLKEQLGFKLVLTVWETLPFADAFRNVRTRKYRRDTLRHADLFLAATQRAADALILEGADAARIELAPPGIDLGRFRPSGETPPQPPTILSAGRLVWEKGHQDVLRAVAFLKRTRPDLPAARVVIVGKGPEGDRLSAYAGELGIGDAVELRDFVPYEQMPGLYASATCLVLGSMPIWSWEEQFGMVLVEAMASGLPIVASTSGAIPEVAGPTSSYFAPGDWRGLADVLADGPLRAPAKHEIRDAERVERFSATAAAERLTSAYDALLGSS